MCRGDRSAHGRASTALSAGAFPHDSTNPPPAGPARMCNTARPGPTPHIQVWPRSPRTHSWHRLRPHAAPSSPRRSPAPEPHPDEKDSFCGRFAGLRPVVLRERAGFQSNAHLPSARSRRIGGVPAGPGDGRDPRDRPGRRDPPQAALPRARRGHRGERQARRGYPGGRRARCPTRGRPPRPTRGRWLSKSATKTSTEPERARRNVDIPRLRSPSIPPQGAFVADSDTPPPQVATGATPAPSFTPRSNEPQQGTATPRQRVAVPHYQGSPARIIDVRSPSTRRPGPDAVQRARGVRCRCCCRPTLGSGGWSCRRRGRRRRPGARPSAGRTHRRAPE